MSGQTPSPKRGASGGVEIAPGKRVPESALDVSFTLGSGPGGQNVNKRATACRLRVAIADLPLSDAQKRRLRVRAGQRVTSEGELIIESGEHRTQNQNRRECMGKLRQLIIQSLSPPKKRIPTRPTRGSKERRLDAKKQRGQIKKMRKNPPAP